MPVSGKNVSREFSSEDEDEDEEDDENSGLEKSNLLPDEDE